MKDPIDTVIVGAGIAGLSAALFLGRAGRSTIVFDGGEPRIFAVEQVREFLGFDGTTPAEMMARGRAEVLRYGVEIRQERVETVVPRADGLFNVTGVGGTVTARTVVLATGAVEELPPLTGVRKAWGLDLKVCPCFDGYEFTDGKFVVFGLPERLAYHASWVRMWSPNVTVVSRHGFNDADAERMRLLDIKVMSDEVTGMIHDGDRLVGVKTASGAEITCDATWIAAGLKAGSELASQLCDIDEAGFAKTDKVGQTSRPGLWAIGNANEPWAHLAHATAAGTGVGPVVTFYLLEQMLGERRAAVGPLAA